MGLTLILIALFLIGIASYAISNVVYKKIIRSETTGAKVLRVVSFIVSFLIISFGVAYLVLSNVTLER